MTYQPMGRRGAARFGPALAIASALAGCAAIGSGPPAAPEAVSDRLYLGRSIPGGDAVADADWDAFVREEVTPRFPGGLTVWRAQGQWREAGGAVLREPVMVVEVVRPRDRAADMAAIARAYKRRFAQEAVLRVTAPVQAGLVE